MINNRSFSENMKKMQEVATEQAKAMRARSQHFSNNYQKRITKDRIPEENNKSTNSDSKSESESKKNNIIEHKNCDSKKNNFSNILKLLESVLNDSDNTLIIVLILLLMDDENNFFILMILFYTLM